MEEETKITLTPFEIFFLITLRRLIQGHLKIYKGKDIDIKIEVVSSDGLKETKVSSVRLGAGYNQFMRDYPGSEAKG